MAEERDAATNGDEMGEDLYYVPQKAIDGIREKIKAGAKDDDVKEFLDSILKPDEVPDEDMMLPVDMRGVGNEYDSVEDMVKARDYFEQNKSKDAEEDRPAPMTAKEWRAALLEGSEEEDLMEGEEEDDMEGEEEEDGEAEEPPAKKGKTE